MFGESWLHPTFDLSCLPGHTDSSHRNIDTADPLASAVLLAGTPECMVQRCRAPPLPKMVRPLLPQMVRPLLPPAGPMGSSIAATLS